MSGDLISRQAAIDALVKYTHITWEHLKIIYPMLNVFEKLPSVERHGRWEPFDLTWGRSVYACTACGEAFEVPTECGKPMYEFCPYCGAKMDIKQWR